MSTLKSEFALYHHIERVLRGAMNEKQPYTVSTIYSDVDVHTVASGTQQVRDHIVTLHKRRMVTAHAVDYGKGHRKERIGYMWNPNYNGTVEDMKNTYRSRWSKGLTGLTTSPIPSGLTGKRLQAAQDALRNLENERAINSQLPPADTLETLREKIEETGAEAPHAEAPQREVIPQEIAPPVVTATTTPDGSKSIEFVFEDFGTTVTIGKNPATGNMRFSFSMEPQKK